MGLAGNLPKIVKLGSFLSKFIIKVGLKASVGGYLSEEQVVDPNQSLNLSEQKHPLFNQAAFI